MGVLEEQARFLTAKYGTAAGPVGLSRTYAAPTPDIAVIMVAVGLLLFAVIAFSVLRQHQSDEERVVSYA